MSLPIAWSEVYAHPLPDGHRFPMEKYSLLPEQLLYEGTISQDQIFVPNPLSEEQILRTHDASYWNRLKHLEMSPREQRVSGFPHNHALINRERIICNGTVIGAQKALDGSQCSFNIAGGTHHAYRDRGEGFCLLNDIAIASNELLHDKRVAQILVVDLDVHQGNGTACIFQKDERVFTFSMHGAKNYPFKKELSNLDVGLPDQIQTEAYLDLLQKHLHELIDLVKPDFIFFQAGVDILETDKLGKLAVSIEGCKERDRLVLALCYQKGIPIQVTMGGGYSKRITDIVEAHANTYRLAMNIFS